MKRIAFVTVCLALAAVVRLSASGDPGDDDDKVVSNRKLTALQKSQAPRKSAVASNASQVKAKTTVSVSNNSNSRSSIANNQETMKTAKLSQSESKPVVRKKNSTVELKSTKTKAH